MPPLPECPRCQGQIAPRRDHNSGSDYLICITCGHEPGTAATLPASQEPGTATEHDFAAAVALGQRQRRKEYETNITELARIRWPQGIICPRCRQPGPRFNPNPATYQPLLCPHCNLQFSPRNGTFINDNIQTKAWIKLLQHTVKRREVPSLSETADLTGHRNRKTVARIVHTLQQAIADSKVDLSQGNPSENATRIINAPAPTPARFKTKPKTPTSSPAAKTATPGAGQKREIPQPGPAIGKLTRIQSLDLIAAIRWPQEVSCLNCGSTNLGYQQTERFWRCRECARRFSAQTDTLFAKQNNLARWAYILTGLHHWQRLPLPSEISAAVNISHAAAAGCINLIQENLPPTETRNSPETIRRTMFTPNQPATVDQNASVAATLDAPTVTTATSGEEKGAEPAVPTTQKYRQFCRPVYRASAGLKSKLTTIYDGSPPSRWNRLTRQALAESLPQLNPSSQTLTEINTALMRHGKVAANADRIYGIIMEQLAKARHGNQAAYPEALNLLSVSEAISKDLSQANQQSASNNQHRMIHLICQDRLGDNIVAATDPAIGKISQALTRYHGGAGKYETFNALIQVLAQK